MFRFSARELIITSEPGLVLLTLGLDFRFNGWKRRKSQTFIHYTQWEPCNSTDIILFFFLSFYFFSIIFFPFSLGLYSFLVGFLFRPVGTRLDRTVQPANGSSCLGGYSKTALWDYPGHTHTDRAGIWPKGYTEKIH